MLGGACTVLRPCLQVQEQCVICMSVVRLGLYIVPTTDGGRGPSYASCRGLQINQDTHQNNVHHDAA